MNTEQINSHGKFTSPILRGFLIIIISTLVAGASLLSPWPALTWLLVAAAWVGQIIGAIFILVGVWQAIQVFLSASKSYKSGRE